MLQQSPATASVDDNSTDQTRWRRAHVPAILVGLAALLPRLLTVGHFMNGDEYLWMARTQFFSDALVHGQFNLMSPSRPFSGTMPGIPTVWLGSLGRGMWELGKPLGLVSPGETFWYSFSGFACAQAMVAIATAALIGLFVWLVTKWVSRRAAVAAGLVLATEPFWVALGSVLHTDELVTLFALTGVVALAWVLGLPNGVVPPRHPRRWLVVAGVLLTCSPLTKLSGLAFGPVVIGILIWAAVVAVRSRPSGSSAAAAARPTLMGALILVAVGVVTVVLLYPALILRPSVEWAALRNAADLAADPRNTFFLGERHPSPGILFYPVTLAYRTTLWTFILVPLGLLVALARRAVRPYALLLVAAVVVPAITLHIGGLHYDRYGLIVIGPLIAASALALKSGVADATRRSRWPERTIALAGIGALAFSSVIAPWGNLSFNPVLSALRPPSKTLRLSWGEEGPMGMEVIERDIRARGLDCRFTTVKGLGKLLVPRTRCTPVRVSRRSDADYLLISESDRQMFLTDENEVRRDFELVGIRSVYGHPVVAVWRKRAATGS